MDIEETGEFTFMGGCWGVTHALVSDDGIARGVEMIRSARRLDPSARFEKGSRYLPRYLRAGRWIRNAENVIITGPTTTSNSLVAKTIAEFARRRGVSPGLTYGMGGIVGFPAPAAGADLLVIEALEAGLVTPTCMKLTRWLVYALSALRPSSSTVITAAVLPHVGCSCGTCAFWWERLRRRAHYIQL